MRDGARDRKDLLLSEGFCDLLRLFFTAGIGVQHGIGDEFVVFVKQDK